MDLNDLAPVRKEYGMTVVKLIWYFSRQKQETGGVSNGYFSCYSFWPKKIRVNHGID